LITRSTSPRAIRSTTVSPPSETFATRATGTPARSRTPAVPLVARRRKPRSASRFAGKTIARLSRLATDTKTVPSVGSDVPVATNALARAVPASASMPITSPVERISGPSTVSTPGNRPKGSTAAFTEVYGRCR
jgi:hypothetical protein